MDLKQRLRQLHDFGLNKNELRSALDKIKPGDKNIDQSAGVSVPATRLNNKSQ